MIGASYFVIPFALGVVWNGVAENTAPFRSSNAIPAVSCPISKSQVGKAKPTPWASFSALSHTFLIARIADAKHKPDQEDEVEESFDGAFASANAGKTLFYIYLPNSASAIQVTHLVKDRQRKLPQPSKIFRHLGSPVSTYFLAASNNPGSLVFRAGGKADTLDLSNATELWNLPFFWSGDPPTVANETLPGWLED